MALRSKAWVFGRSLAGVAVSNMGAKRGHVCLSVVSAVCHVEVSVTGSVFAQRVRESSGSIDSIKNQI